MRRIDNIVLHCTATPQGTRVESILAYWRNTLKWRNVGYHFLIEANGRVHALAPIEQVTNGVAGHNSNSIHISYIGGVDSNGRAVDNRTPQQRKEMLRLVREMRAKFPTARIRGHRDFPNVRKECPSFDVARWLREVGVS